MKIDTIPHLFFQYEASIWSAGQEEDKMNRWRSELHIYLQHVLAISICTAIRFLFLGWITRL
jgi:hypothetical protein